MAVKAAIPCATDEGKINQRCMEKNVICYALQNCFKPSAFSEIGHKALDAKGNSACNTPWWWDRTLPHCGITQGSGKPCLSQGDGYGPVGRSLGAKTVSTHKGMKPGRALAKAILNNSKVLCLTLLPCSLDYMLHSLPHQNEPIAACDIKPFPGFPECWVVVSQLVGQVNPFMFCYTQQWQHGKAPWQLSNPSYTFPQSNP